MQAYPGRSPLLDTLRGKTSVRQLRVMLEHLPRGNPAQREIHGLWGDTDWMLHDVSFQLRRLNANYFNTHRGKSAAIHAEPLPDPQTAAKKVDNRSPEQIKAEREHLLAVLRRDSTS